MEQRWALTQCRTLRGSAYIDAFEKVCARAASRRIRIQFGGAAPPAAGCIMQSVKFVLPLKFPSQLDLWMQRVLWGISQSERRITISMAKRRERARAHIVQNTPNNILFHYALLLPLSASAFAFFAHKIKYPSLSLALLSRAPFFISSRAAHLLEMFMPCERKMRKLRQRHFSLSVPTPLTYDA
jgi:hypothetical protein